MPHFIQYVMLRFCNHSVNVIALICLTIVTTLSLYNWNLCRWHKCIIYVNNSENSNNTVICNVLFLLTKNISMFTVHYSNPLVKFVWYFSKSIFSDLFRSLFPFFDLFSKKLMQSSMKGCNETVGVGKKWMEMSNSRKVEMSKSRNVEKWNENLFLSGIIC